MRDIKVFERFNAKHQSINETDGLFTTNQTKPLGAWTLGVLHRHAEAVFRLIEQFKPNIIKPP